MRAALDPDWRVHPAGAVLEVFLGDRRWVVDLPDLAARHPAGPDARACAGVAACLRRVAASSPNFAAVRDHLLPCLWRGDGFPSLVALLRRPWREPLWVGYGAAEPECTLAVTLEQLPAWGVSAQDVDRTALANLQAVAQPPERVVAGVLYALTGGPSPERNASGVLLPATMERCAHLFETRRILAGLPHRGCAVILRACREEEPAEVAARRLDRARALIARQFRESPYPLDDRLFSWVDGRWAPPAVSGTLWTPA